MSFSPNVIWVAYYRLFSNRMKSLRVEQVVIQSFDCAEIKSTIVLYALEVVC
jgi:hypothetical protein